MEKFRIIQERDREEDISIEHFALHGLLPQGCTLALHAETRTLSLMADGPRLLRQQTFSDNEMRIIIPILQAFPRYCPYEILLANLTSDAVDAAAIRRSQHFLKEAQSNGTWHQELRPIRRALSSLRSKLHLFHLEISTVRERGCSLTSLIVP